MKLRHPRVLVVTSGPTSKHSLIASALADQYKCEILPGKAYKEHRIDRILRILGMGAIAANIKKINQVLLEKAGTFDILFIVKGNFISKETLRKLKMLPSPPIVVGWTPDDMSMPHNNSKIFKLAAPYYDYYFTAKSLNVRGNELKRFGFKRVEFLHQGFDSNIHAPLRVSNSYFQGKVVFVGYGEASRFHYMNYLAKNGIEVHVWGNGWKKWMRVMSNKRLHIYGHPLIGKDYTEALTNAKISLCFLRKINRDLHTSRTFEIPACGGFMLPERTDEHKLYFSEGTEAVFFESKEELLDRVRYFLKNEIERRSIADAGYRRTQNSDYSYHYLVRYMIERVSH